MSDIRPNDQAAGTDPQAAAATEVLPVGPDDLPTEVLPTNPAAPAEPAAPADQVDPIDAVWSAASASTLSREPTEPADLARSRRPRTTTIVWGTFLLVCGLLTILLGTGTHLSLTVIVVLALAATGVALLLAAALPDRTQR